MQKIYFKVDTQGHVFLNESFQPVGADQFICFRGDQYILCLEFVRFVNGAWTADPQASTSLRALGLKIAGDYFDPQFLAYTGPAGWNQAGDWADCNPAIGLESCRVDLSDANLLAKFMDGDAEIAEDYLTFTFEIELTDLLGNKSTVVQQYAAIYKDVIRGTEDLTTTATPLKPTLAECQALFVQQNTEGGDFRQKDSKLQKINRTTGLFHDWGFETVDGVVVMWINQTGEA